MDFNLDFLEGIDYRLIYVGPCGQRHCKYSPSSSSASGLVADDFILVVFTGSGLWL